MVRKAIPSGVIKHGWLEHESFIGDFPVKTSIFTGIWLPEGRWNLWNLWWLLIGCNWDMARHVFTLYYIILHSPQALDALSLFLIDETSHDRDPDAKNLRFANPKQTLKWCQLREAWVSSSWIPEFRAELDFIDLEVSIAFPFIGAPAVLIQLEMGDFSSINHP